MENNFYSTPRAICMECEQPMNDHASWCSDADAPIVGFLNSVADAILSMEPEQ